MGRRGRTVVGWGMLGLFVFALGVFLLPFAFPTPPPIVTRFQATRLFSPNDDARRELARISVRMRTPGTVTLDVVGTDGTPVRTLLTDEPVPRGWVRAAWGGRDDAGEPVPDGIYSLRLRARSGQKVFRTSRRIVIDRQGPDLAFADARSAGVSLIPPPAQCVVSALPDGDAAVTFVAGPPARPGGTALRTSGPRPVRDGRTVRWAWDGWDAGGNAIPTGLTTVEIRAADTAGNTVTARRTCWIGNVVGRVAAPGRAGGDIRVRLRTPRGTPVTPDTAVTLRLYRRAGIPGPSARVLGPRVALPVRTTAGAAVMRLPATVPPGALWLVAETPAGRALIDPAGAR